MTGVFWRVDEIWSLFRASCIYILIKTWFLFCVILLWYE